MYHTVVVNDDWLSCCTAILPPINIIPSDPTIELEPDREFTLTCESTGPYRGEVEWQRSDESPVSSMNYYYIVELT